METKIIYVFDLLSCREFDVEIEINETIRELKEKIEKKLNRKIESKLKILTKGRRTEQILENEELTVKEARIHNGVRINIK